MFNIQCSMFNAHLKVYDCVGSLTNIWPARIFSRVIQVDPVLPVLLMIVHIVDGLIAEEMDDGLLHFLK
jgi:hypothetical protein